MTDSTNYDPESEPDAETRTKTRTILLLEDELPHATLIREAFEESKSGWKIHHVATLNEAKKWLDENKNEPPALILADYLLPDGKGTDLIEKAKKLSEAGVGIPVIILTAYGTEELAVRSIKSGAIDYVTKTTELFRNIPWIAERALREWENIVERKRAEEKIEASLREKEALLREIHHRVKNNLQIISSLLSMQARKAKDENVIVSLLDSRSRIQTMSLIHAQLYQSENLEQVEMGTTIRKLVSFMLQIYAEAKKNITSVVTAEDVTLPISQAIPCGLIINELVSNVLKHAFKGMTEGSFEIYMRESADDKIKLTVKDNGIGIPEELDIYKTDTLGLKIVRTLAEEQLKGKMRLIRDKGTEFYIEFNKSITN